MSEAYPDQKSYKLRPPIPDNSWQEAPAFVSSEPTASASRKLGADSDDKEPKEENPDFLEEHEASPQEPEEDASLKLRPPESLTREELLERLAQAEKTCARYDHVARKLLSALALSPVMNDFYSRHARILLRDALLSLPSVSEVGHVECSMPSLASGSDAPFVEPVRFDGLQYSEWDVEWRPRSWWLSVAIKTPLLLRIYVRLTGMGVVGRMRCSLSADLSSVRLAFSRRPSVWWTTETRVLGFGAVPEVLKSGLDAEIANQVERFTVSNTAKR